MKLLTFYVACICQLGGTEVRCEEETRSQNADFLTRIHSVATRWANGFPFDYKSFIKNLNIDRTLCAL